MTVDLAPALPVAVLLGGAGMLAILHAVAPADERVTVWLGALVAAASAVAAVAAGCGDAAGGALTLDASATLFAAIVGAGAALALLAAAPAILASPAAAAHVVALMLVAAAGAVVTVMGRDLVALVVAALLLWLPLEVLARVAGPRGQGSGPLAGVVVALLASGVVIVAAAEGTTRIAALAGASDAPGRAGLALVAAAFALGAGLLPFSSPLAAGTPHAPFRAVVPPVAAFAVLVRLGSVATASADGAVDWRAMIAVLAAATIIVPTLAASVERSLAGVVAQASSAQFGYAALALAAGPAATASVVAALAAAALTVLAGYAAVGALGTRSAEPGLGGLARARPLVAVSAAVTLLAAAGLPGTLGFAARVAVFADAARAQLAWLVILGTLAGAVWMVVALRLVVAMMRGAGTWGRVDVASAGVLAGCAAALLVFGIAPGPLMEVLRGAGYSIGLIVKGL